MTTTRSSRSNPRRRSSARTTTKTKVRPCLRSITRPRPLRVLTRPLPSTASASKRAKVGKNPSVDTHFLPDREREEAERRERDELRKKWLKMQDDMKQEEIEITYSYWDGSGHRKVVTVRSFVFFLVLRECD